MSSTSGDNDFLHRLETNVRAELALVETSQPTAEAAAPTEQWLFEQVEAEHYDVGLRGLLAAVEALEDGPTRPVPTPLSSQPASLERSRD